MERLKNLAIALVLATLALSAEWFNQIISPEENFFFQRVNQSGVICVHLMLLIFAAFFFFLLEAARKAETPFVEKLSYLLLISVLLIATNNIRSLSGFSVRHPYFSLSCFLGNWGHLGNWLKIILFVGFGLCLYLYHSGWVIWFFRNALLVLFLFPLWAFAAVGWGAQDNQIQTSFDQAAGARPVGPRVLWMVFDEMDAHFAFDARPESVQLPAFDDFASQALSATDARAPANDTIFSLPAYFTGKFVAETRPLDRDDLSLTFCQGGVSTLSQEPNIFSDARALGLRTAALGWYLPYCRLFKKNLDLCSWRAFLQFQYQDRVLSNAPEVVARAVGRRADFRQIHQGVFEGVLASAEAAVASADLGLTFIHWPVPHLPGIPRGPKRFLYPANEMIEAYYNNLILADEALGKIRVRMEAADLWDQTTVIITSDHVWREGPRWPAEDGKGMLRRRQIPLLIKLPGQKRGTLYQRPLHTVFLRGLIPDLINRKVTTPVELAHWLDGTPSPSALGPTPRNCPL